MWFYWLFYIYFILLVFYKTSVIWFSTAQGQRSKTPPLTQLNRYMVETDCLWIFQRKDIHYVIVYSNGMACAIFMVIGGLCCIASSSGLVCRTGSTAIESRRHLYFGCNNLDPAGANYRSAVKQKQSATHHSQIWQGKNRKLGHPYFLSAANWILGGVYPGIHPLIMGHLLIYINAKICRKKDRRAQ